MPRKQPRMHYVIAKQLKGADQLETVTGLKYGTINEAKTLLTTINSTHGEGHKLYRLVEYLDII